MSDTLVIFGTEYANVPGLKVKDENENTLTFIRPQGQLAISENGTVDVSQYASVDVDVAGGTGGVSQDTSGAIVLSPDGDGAINWDYDAIAMKQYCVDLDGKDLVLNSATAVYANIFKNGKMKSITAPLVSTTTLARGNSPADGDGIGSYVFARCPNLESVWMPALANTGSGGYQFAYNTKLTDVYTPKMTTGQYCFTGCTSLVHIALPGCTSMNGNAFRGCSNLEAVDFTSITKFGSNEFYNCSKMATLIIRKTSVLPLSNVNNFSGTPFASGKAGGTIYIPKVLYDALGTGTNDYKAATNWSTVDGYGTITWAQIEGSQYENYYVDGRGVLQDITNTLTNCTSSDAEERTDKGWRSAQHYGQPFSTIITANEGYTLSSVTVTMDETDITSTAYNSSTGEISIASVTGPITITATAA